MNKAVLTLENGMKFEGYGFGAAGEVSGEVVFATNMTGFQEALTNSAYKGKIVVQTFPVVGAPGANGEDNLSEESPAGYVVREYCEEPSNFRAEEGIEPLMKRRGVVGLYGVDTRRLTHVIRDNGNSIKGTLAWVSA